MARNPSGAHEQPHTLPDGFADFFEANRTRLFSALCILTRDRHEAEEITQDAFVRVWERWARVAAMDDPTGYLYRTAMNEYRGRGRRLARALRLTPTRYADDELARVLDRDELSRQLAKIPERERAAMVLTELLGFQSDEAGEILGIRPSTVRVLTHRARARFAEGGIT